MSESVEIYDGDDKPLVDSILQPPHPSAQSKEDVTFFAHPAQYSGQSCRDKIAKITALMRQHDLSHLHVSMSEEIAWLLNLRARGQHEFDPMFNASLLLSRAGKVTLFLEASLCDVIDRKMLEEPVDVLCDAQMALKFGEELGRDSKVAVDSSSCSYYAYRLY